MKKKDTEEQQPAAQENSKSVSRRSFLAGSGGVGAVAAVAATGLLGGASPLTAQGGKSASARVTKELPIPDTYEADRPKQTEHSVDVLVIGGGYAGVNAAYSARKAGRNVMLIDKGRPGYSGQSPWPGTFNFFDPDLGDDAQLVRENIRYGSEYIGNLDWIDIWISRS